MMTRLFCMSVVATTALVATAHSAARPRNRLFSNGERSMGEPALDPFNGNGGLDVALT